MRSLLGRFHRPMSRGLVNNMLTMNNLGDGSTLSLDFTTMGGVLDPRLTFSRAGGGTYVGPDGYIYGVDSATSASLAIGTGSKSVTLTATAGVDRRFQVGQTVYFSSGANNMNGLVTAYDASTQVITINATATTGSGSFTSWFVGNASPRFDYDPVTLAPRGLLIEGTATNFMAQSTTLDPHNVAAMRTISTASITDPEGTTTKARIIAADGSTGYHARHLVTTASTNTTLTVSIFAKKNGYKYLFLAEIGSGRSAVRFDLDNGTTSNSSGAGFVSATATQHPNGWWRCSMVVNVTASTGYAWSYVGVPTTGATLGNYGAQYTGTNTDSDGIYCYGFQVEAGSGASSLIPTGASGVTRTPDLLAVTSTTTMGLNTSEGTFFVETELPRAGTTSPSQFGTPYANGSWLGQFYGSTDATTLTANWWGGSVLPLLRLGNPKSLTALSYGLYTGTSIPVSSSLNGAVSTGTFTTSGANNAPNPATWSFITLACNSTSLGTTSIDNFNGCIKRFKYFPTRLTDAQLQTLTAP